MPAGARSPPTAVERIRASQRSAQVNRKCADCSERGPTYVCIDFHSFVCQTCSGIHREFGHKIKSISLSDWTLGEVEAIEAGGNERANQIWLARADPGMEEVQNSDMDKVRDYIREKYVEKRWFHQAGAELKEMDAAKVTSVEPTPAAAMKAPVGDLLSDVDSPPSITDFALDSPTTAKAVESVATTAEVGLVSLELGPAEPAAAWVADFGGETAAGGQAQATDSAGCFLLSDTNLLADLSFDAPHQVHAPAEDANKGLSAGPLQGFGALWDTPVKEVKEAPLIGFEDPLAKQLPFAAFPEADASNNAAKSPVAEPAEEPAPFAADTPPTDSKAIGEVSFMPQLCAAQATAEGEVAALGDKLRQAVLSGNSKDLMSIFEECSMHQLPSQRRAEENAHRFAAFDELGQDGASNAATASTQLVQPEVEADASNAVQAPTADAAAATVLEVDELPLPEQHEQCLTPKGNKDDAGRQAPQMFFIGDEDSPCSQKVHEMMFSPMERLGQHAQPVPQPQSLASSLSMQATPQALGQMTPEQLKQMSPQELLQMQMMISRALQSHQIPSPSQGSWQAPGAQGSAATASRPRQAAPEAASQPAAPAAEFGDLVAEFQKKNQIGLGSAPS